MFLGFDQMIGLHLPRDPLLAIIGVILKTVMSRKKKHSLHGILAAAKKSNNIELALKKDPPADDTRQSVVKVIYTMEKITFMLRLQDAEFSD